MSPVDLSTHRARIRAADPYLLNGRVAELIGLIIASRGPEAKIGELCEIMVRGSRDRHFGLAAEVVGFRSGRTLLMPLGPPAGIGPGQNVVATGDSVRVDASEALLGRVLDGLGRPLDGRALPPAEERRPVDAEPPSPLARSPIREPLSLGVRAIDGLMPCGRGQRMGIFSGSGVGKSTLLGMMARSSDAAVNVIALVGERGREVREFIENALGPEGLARSVVVVATSDQPALVRIKAAFLATAIAEFFRDRGRDVLLMMDSVTRLATAQREVGLAVGEPPATRGYPPSVFAMLPRLLERAGTSERGSITGLYTVLVEGDDMNEPVADATRAILDGHIVLSRALAHRNHYPAIDVLQSVSRLTTQLLDRDQVAAAGRLRELLAAHAEAQDLIAIGAYVAGSDPTVDEARAKLADIEAFLCQAVDEPYRADETPPALAALAAPDPTPSAMSPPATATAEAETPPIVDPLPPGAEIVGVSG